MGNYTASAGYNKLSIEASDIIFYTGTQGTTSSTEKLRITNDGKFGFNKSNPANDLVLKTTAAHTSMVIMSASESTQLSLQTVQDSDVRVGTISNHPLTIYSNSLERMRLDTYGTLRVGNTHTQTTSSNTKRIALGAKGSIWGWASGQIDGALTLADNYYWDGANNKAIENDYSAYLTLRSGSMRFGTTSQTHAAGANVSGGISEKVRFQQGGGISFNGDTAAANALDDYEEGSWTPVYTSSNSTISYSIQQGSYTKVGNVVTVSFYIRTSSVSSTSHSLVKVSGLPFAEGKSQRTPGSIRAFGFQSSGTFEGFPITWTVEAGQTHGELLKLAATGTTDFTTSTMNDSSHVYGQAVYHAA